jgi:hypothetical protein
MKKGAILFGFLMITSTAFAATETTDIETSVSKSHSGYLQTSEENRMGKLANVALTTGFGPNVIMNQGISAGFYLSSNSLIMVDYLNGDSSRKVSGSTENISGDTKVRDFGVYYKRFFGNSFFARGGVMHREVSDKYSGTTWLGKTQYGEYEGSAEIAVVAIGNEWQWENFSLGCEWVGATQPFSKHVAKDESVNRSGDIFGSMFTTPQGLISDSGLMLTHLYVGASF